MEAARRQPAMLQGLSHFLVEHERCGAGFDVAHPSGLGSGHVSIACRGCGARHDYATATIEFEREIEFAPVPATSTRATATPPLTPYVERLEPLDEATGLLPPLEQPKPAAREPLRAKPAKSPSGAPPRKEKRRRDRVIIGGLLVFAGVALTFAVIRVSNSVNQSSDTSEPAPIQTPATSKAPKAKAAPRVHPGPIAPPPTHAKQGPKASVTSPAPPVRTIRTARFAITVPVAWAQHTPGGGLTLAPAGAASVSIQVFYENNPSLTMQRMTTETASFLHSRDPGATISSSEAVRVAGNPRFKLRANGPAGSQTALAVLSGPYRYLVVESADPGTPASRKTQADRALNSFRPR